MERCSRCFTQAGLADRCPGLVVAEELATAWIWAAVHAHASPLSRSQGQQVGVGELARLQQPGSIDADGMEQADPIGPELVLGMADQFGHDGRHHRRRPGSSQADPMTLIELGLDGMVQGIEPLPQLRLVRDLAERAVHLQG